MKTLITIAVLLACLGAAGCANIAKGTSRGPIAMACKDKLDLAPGVCTCFEKKAAGELSDDSYNFVAATLRGDERATRRTRKDLSLSEATAAGLVLATAPAACLGNR